MTTYPRPGTEVLCSSYLHDRDLYAFFSRLHKDPVVAKSGGAPVLIEPACVAQELSAHASSARQLTVANGPLVSCAEPGYGPSQPRVRRAGRTPDGRWKRWSRSRSCFRFCPARPKRLGPSAKK